MYNELYPFLLHGLVMLFVLQVIDILKQMLVCGPDNNGDHD